MTIQDFFYLFGIIAMLLTLAMLIGTVVLAFIIKDKIFALHNDIKSKLAAIKDFHISPDQIAEDVGALTAELTAKIPAPKKVPSSSKKSHKDK